MCSHVCSQIWVHGWWYVCTHAQVCMETGSLPLVFSSVSLSLTFWDRTCHWTWSFLIPLDWLVNNSWNLPSSVSSVFEETCSDFLVYGCKESNSGHHTYMASPLLAEQYPSSHTVSSARYQVNVFFFPSFFSTANWASSLAHAWQALHSWVTSNSPASISWVPWL